VSERGMETLRAAAERFYAAANAVVRGDAQPMLAMWSHGADVTYCDPGGAIHRGWEALQAYWERGAQLNRAADSRITARPEIVAMLVVGDLGYTVALEHVEAVATDSVRRMVGRATNVYRREQEEWRMIHRHAEPGREEQATQ
jgi:SnoaL-like domain